MSKKYYFTYDIDDGLIFGFSTSPSKSLKNAEELWSFFFYGIRPEMETIECPKSFFNEVKFNVKNIREQWYFVNGVPMFSSQLLKCIGQSGSKIKIEKLS